MKQRKDGLHLLPRWEEWANRIAAWRYYLSQINVIKRKRGFWSWLIINFHCGIHLHRQYTIHAPKELRAIGCYDCLMAHKTGE